MKGNLNLNYNILEYLHNSLGKAHKEMVWGGITWLNPIWSQSPDLDLEDKLKYRLRARGYVVESVLVRWSNTMQEVQLKTYQTPKHCTAMYITSILLQYSWKLETIILSFATIIATKNKMIYYLSTVFFRCINAVVPFKWKRGLHLFLNCCYLSERCLPPSSEVLLSGSKSLQLDPKILQRAFPEEWMLLQYPVQWHAKVWEPLVKISLTVNS